MMVSVAGNCNSCDDQPSELVTKNVARLSDKKSFRLAVRRAETASPADEAYRITVARTPLRASSSLVASFDVADFISSKFT